MVSSHGRPGDDELTTAARLLTDPRERRTVESLLREALVKVEPDQVGVSEALFEPLLARAARGEPVERGTDTLRGGFGGADLAVLALLPLILHAVAHLVRAFGRNWPAELADRRSRGGDGAGLKFALSVKDAEILIRETGSSGSTYETLELVRAVHDAILAHAEKVAGPSTPAARRAPTFRDFAVRVSGDGSGGFEAQVLPSSGGGGPVPFHPPFDLAELPAALRSLELRVRGPVRHLPPVERRRQREPDTESCGGTLFEALFTGGIRDAYESARASARSRGHGLRIRLILDPRHPTLSAAPWELLFDRRTRHFLSHDLRTPVVRHLEPPGPTEPRLDPTTPPLRLLVASALPCDVAGLDVGEECRRIEESLGARRDFDTRVVTQATSRALRRELRDFAPHILHFIGHGALREPDGQAAALFVDSEDHSDPMSGAELAAVLQGSVDLRLVALNSCNSGALPRLHGLDAFSGVASALIRGGRPAVVAMQFPITDGAAVAFGGAFYEALGNGDPVEVAVVEGRQAILDLDRKRGSFEWATPVLYLGVDDGDLFRPQTR